MFTSAVPMGSAALPFLLFFSAALLPSLMASSSSQGGGSDADVYNGELTPLQKHVAFFDRNKDGVVYPSETFQGFRAIGCGVALSTTAAAFINGFLSPKTSDGKFPSPSLPIYVKNIHKGKHGSDSGVYDANGRFVPEKFEEIFQKHSHVNRNALTSDELTEMLQANQVPKDYQGWLASRIEWKILFDLCKDKDGLLQKDTIRAVYDGSLFLQMEKERADSQKKA